MIIIITVGLTGFWA